MRPRPLGLDVGPRPLSEAEIGIQRQGPAMEHQPTLGGGKRAPLGSTILKEDAMSVVVGIDVGAYKHAATVCRGGEREAEKKVFRYEATRSGFDELDAWLQRQGQVDRVVVESSGHYWWPLASHLRQRGVPLAVVNPLEAKYLRSCVASSGVNLGPP